MREYHVKGGDSLSEIARRELGDARRWPDIYAANKEAMDYAYDRALPTLDRITSGRHNINLPADLLTAGQVLRLPD